MCGRYTLIKLSDLLAYFPWIGAPAIMPESRYNIAPSQSIAAITNETAGPVVDYLRWGLVPSWASDGSITAGSRMINARAETLTQKPAFSRLLKRQRCLIPADGFFEWKKEGREKTPYLFELNDHQPFAFAGLWDHWRDPHGNNLRTCTIITTAANAVVAPVHPRMPVILKKAQCQQWIDPHELSPDSAAEMLAPYPAQEMTAHPVSSQVNSPANEGPRLIIRSEPIKKIPFQPGLFET